MKTLTFAWTMLLGLCSTAALLTFLLVVASASAATWGTGVTAAALLLALLGIVGMVHLPSQPR